MDWVEYDSQLPDGKGIIKRLQRLQEIKYGSLSHD